MDILYTHCAGLDVHKKTVMVCCIVPGKDGTPQYLRRSFSTMTHDLLLLADWLTSLGVTHVAMEATGEFWKPVYNILESSFTLLVVNARHIKNVPGRKTDVKDAEWIAELLRHGLLRPSFIPPVPQRDLRDLTRQRTNLVQDRATVVLRLQKVLEWANLKLASVATDITGVSARAMLEGIIGGEADAVVLAEFAHGRMRSKRAALEQALTGRVREHHRYLLAQHLMQMDFLDEQIEDLEGQIRQMLVHEGEQDGPPSHGEEGEGCGTSQEATSGGDSRDGGSVMAWADAVELLDTIPGVGRTAAEQIIAEIGTDMGRFRSAAHLASWARMCPGNNESAGKRFSGKTGQGNRWLRSVLVQTAWAAVKVKDSHLAGVYGRLAGRRGAKRAIFAVAHRILVAAYYMLRKHAPYSEPGAPPVDEERKARVLERMLKRIEKFGYTARLEPLSAPVS
jgi:transposase